MSDSLVAIQEVNFAGLHNSSDVVPRDRYIQYVNDLYKIYAGEATKETFLEGDQATYAELGDNLFKQEAIRNKLDTIETIVVAHWSQEFDPDYASCGPYFLHKYGLNSDIFDVCDCGTLAPFIGLKILNQYIQSDAIKKGMLLCLEQTTIPRDKEHGDVIPQESGAIAVVLEKTLTASSYRIREIDVITESNVLKNLDKIDGYIFNKLQKFEVDCSDILVVTRKSTTIWKSIKRNLVLCSSVFYEKQFDFIEPLPGCLSLMKKLRDIIEKKQNKKYILLVDEDVESMTVAYIFLEKSIC